MEPEMEIGYPTDVKHVTHIGIDGSTITNNVKGWDNMKAPELLSLSPISFKQFELAMASQAQYPLINDPNSSKCGQNTSGNVGTSNFQVPSSNCRLIMIDDNVSRSSYTSAQIENS